MERDYSYYNDFCARGREGTVTSLRPPRLCRLAVFSIKPTLLSYIVIVIARRPLPCALRCLANPALGHERCGPMPRHHLYHHPVLSLWCLPELPTDVTFSSFFYFCMPSASACSSEVTVTSTATPSIVSHRGVLIQTIVLSRVLRLQLSEATLPREREAWVLTIELYSCASSSQVLVTSR